MRKEFFNIVLTILLVINTGLLLFIWLKDEPKIPSDTQQIIRGDISLNQGGVSSSATQGGNYWTYISNQNKIYYISKPDGSGKINIYSNVLLK